MSVRLRDTAIDPVDQLVAAGTCDQPPSYLSWLREREAQREASRQEILRTRRQGVPDDDAEADLVMGATSRRSLAQLDRCEPSTRSAWTRSVLPFS